MKYKIEVEGTEDFIRILDKMEDVIQSNELKEYIGKQAIKVINNAAREKLENSSSYIDHNKMEIQKNGILLYNDVENTNGVRYSLIIEYGSGTKMDEENAEHMGTTPEFIESGFEWWYAGNHVKVHGQDPKYIYTDAAIKIEHEINDWISDYLSEKL